MGPSPKRLGGFFWSAEMDNISTYLQSNYKAYFSVPLLDFEHDTMQHVITLPKLIKSWDFAETKRPIFLFESSENRNGLAVNLTRI